MYIHTRFSFILAFSLPFPHYRPPHRPWGYRSAPLKPFRPSEISNSHTLSVMRQRYQASRTGRGCRAQYDSNTWPHPFAQPDICRASFVPRPGQCDNPALQGQRRTEVRRTGRHIVPSACASIVSIEKRGHSGVWGRKVPRLALSHRAIAGSGGIQSSNIDY